MWGHRDGKGTSKPGQELGTAQEATAGQDPGE